MGKALIVGHFQGVQKVHIWLDALVVSFSRKQREMEFMIRVQRETKMREGR